MNDLLKKLFPRIFGILKSIKEIQREVTDIEIRTLQIEQNCATSLQARNIGLELEKINRLIIQNRIFQSNLETEEKPQLLDEVKTLSESYGLLQKACPRTYQLWTELFQNNEEEYSDLPAGSCSIEGNKGAEQFREYLKDMIHGYVLDIGCGVQGSPIYIDFYDPQKLYGIDPLPPISKHAFEFHQAICEYLPWKDGSFDAVVVGTSFDHVMLLDKAIEEIVRVLKKRGTLAIWTSFSEGSPKYNAYDSTLEPYDRFHLFHFDHPWFIEMMEKYFVLWDETSIEASSFFLWIKR